MTIRRVAFSRLTRLASLALAVVIAATALVSVETQAQQLERRRTLFDVLFGTRQPEYVPPREVRRPIREPRPRKKTGGSITRIDTRAPTSRAVPAAPPPPEKLDNAKKVLVIGDFVAGGLGEGLKSAFEDAPGVVIETRANGSSGLVRDDFYDWTGTLPGLISELRPSVVVIQIGANDRQQLVTAAAKYDFRTDAWFTAYATRVTALAEVAVKAKIPLIWVGLPAFRTQNMTADALRLNTLYRTNIEKLGGEFVDVWDGFVDQDGRFIVTGSDINGQPVRLRGNDGIGFTAPGKRKLAFYVEKSVRRLLGDMSSPDLVRLDATNLPALIDLPPVKEDKGIVSTPPIDLFDPELDGATELLGGAPLPATGQKSARDMLVRSGKLPDPPVGRVDYVQRPVDTVATP
ncbi:hypothetical protein ASE36_12875 [Rhizobium sp. Root274]|uniref:SGNH/GDSL hydrolase family protein n=1 Tax=unclassified Rhizobium TaxID=2613769 RepID=UPI0007139E03|nr:MULTISPECIES: DUF459 domain-containing protein [unclassified Rhizobium]KQW29331.1 hypothetical protein ASC71_12900 [Rhizobium sp. Root1240]KRD29523.1 hypothetical protein ASE36_12875 [Rhizobium sp. Root274]